MSSSSVMSGKRSRNEDDDKNDNVNTNDSDADSNNNKSDPRNGNTMALKLIQQHMYMMPYLPSFVLQLKQDKKKIYLMRIPSGLPVSEKADSSKSFIDKIIPNFSISHGIDFNETVFNNPIKSAIKDNCINWLEIDPKPDAMCKYVFSKKTLNDEGKIITELLERDASDHNENASRRKRKTKDDSSIISEYRKNVQLTGIVCNNLGLILSSESIVDTIQALHEKCIPGYNTLQDRDKTSALKTIIPIPRYGATFYTPVYIGGNPGKHLKAGLEEESGVQVDSRGNWLITHSFPVTDAAVFTYKTINDSSSSSSSSSSSNSMAIDNSIRSPTTGLLEFFDFSSPLDKSDVRQQAREAIFAIDDHKKSVSVDGLALWIWIGFDRSSEEPRKSTEYPYGIDSLTTGIQCDFSSRFGETEAGGCRNIVMLFEPPLIVNEGQSLKVSSMADLTGHQPKYSFDAQVIGKKSSDVKIHKTIKMDPLYHQYQVFNY